MDDGPPTRSGAGVLQTKLHLPPPPHAHVDRPRLDEAAPTRRLTLVSAPAGFGKSVVAADWCRRSGMATAWISLDAGDDDPARFWRHLAAAIEAAVGPTPTALQDGVARLLVDGAPPTPDEVMTAVVNAVEATGTDLVLVLDDYHAISDPRVHDSVRFLLAHGPARLRIVLVTRADPPLPLARLRARGELAEVRADDLRFRGSEAADVLRATARHDLPEVAVRALEHRTEGWAAGLQLAGLSLASRDDVEDFVAAFSGTNRFVLDFLSEEVLERQPVDVRDFLVETSALDVLSGPLCDAVTGRDDSQQMLESIERSNLFLVPLDDVRRSWRYHHLFADLLRVRLGQRPTEEVQGLHRRAAAWFEGQGSPDEAVQHALAGDDADAARRIVERYADELLLRREGTTVQRWFEALPDDGASSRRLLLARARVELYRGRVAEAEALLDEAEHAEQPRDDGTFEPTSGRVASPLATLVPTAMLLRAFAAHLRGRADDQLRHARAAIDELGEQDPTAPLLIARWHLATAPWLLGDVATAEPALADNVEAWRLAGQHERAAWAAHTLGRIQRAAGRPDAAVATYQEVLAQDADDEVRPPAAAVAHHGLAELAYERDDLAAALAHADAAIERCRGFIHSETLAAALGVVARVRAAEGDVDAARELFDEAAGLGPDGDVAELLDPTPARRATLLVRDGDLAGAATWLDDHGLAVAEASHAREPGLLVLARLRIAEGRPEEAAPLLAALADAADRDGRCGSLVEIEVVRACCLDAMGEDDVALETLAHAVTLAAPQGATRTFIDEAGVGPLLGRLVGVSTADGPLVSDAVAVQHLRRLTDAFDERLLGVSTREVDAVPGMVVPLTEREREVLGLLAEGLRNRDISEQLFISINTTKTHVSRVLAKLGVQTRTAAAQRARDLGLLEA